MTFFCYFGIFIRFPQTTDMSAMTDFIAPTLRAYFPTLTEFEVHPVSIGHINKTYDIRFRNASGHYILQNINTTVFQNPIQVMENILSVGHYLKTTDYQKNILLPIQTADNQFFVQERDSFWRLYPYIEDTYIISKCETADSAYKAAYTFAEYAWYLKDFPTNKLNQTIPDFHNTNLRYQQFFFLSKKVYDQQTPDVQSVIEELHQFRYLLGAIRHLKLPVRVAHNDTKINNLLFSKGTNEPVCIVDLDTLMPSTILYDFGDMVRTCTPTVNENSDDFSSIRVRKDILDAITVGYYEGFREALTYLEEKLLYYGGRLIIFEQALRFMTDYLRGNVYYEVSYPEQNLVRAKNQLFLLKDFVQY